MVHFQADSGEEGGNLTSDTNLDTFITNTAQTKMHILFRDTPVRVRRAEKASRGEPQQSRRNEIFYIITRVSPVV